MTKKAPKSVLEAAKVFAERALGERGTQTGLAKRWGVSQPAVSEVLAGNGIGISVLVAMCSAEGFSADEVLGLRAPSSGSGDGSAPDRPARRLRDLPSWPAAAERARLAVDELDAPLVDEVGGFVPPAPIERVTVAFVTALVGAWKGVRPVGDLPPLARPTTFASPAVGEARSVGAEEEGKSGKGRRKK